MSMRFCVCLAAAGMGATLAGQTPAEAPKFEVASVKPAAPESGPGGGRFPQMREMMRNSRPPGIIPTMDAGRVRIQDWTLLDLIAAAYSIRPLQISGPSWLSDQSWDIDAKVPEGAQKDQLNRMLQALLEERFGLQAHRESETKSGFALVVGKNGPKLKTADPAADPPKNLSKEEQQARAKEQAAAAMRRMQESMK